MFVLAENDFRKSFYMKPCVWLRMENRVFRKIIYFDRKIAPLTQKIFSAFVLPSNYFWRCAKRETEREKGLTDAQTEREREREIALVRSLSSSPPRDGEIASWTHEPITVLVPSMRRWDHATNPRTDRPTSSTSEIAPRTHESINPSLILTDEPIAPRLVLWFWIFFFVLIFVIVFVWILRKCEKHDKNGFSRAFLATQPNTWKYFPFLKIFSLENILPSENIWHSTKHSLILLFNNLEAIVRNGLHNLSHQTFSFSVHI